MTLTIHVEHEVIGGEPVLETFEGVETFLNPPMTGTSLVKFAGDRENQKLKHGVLVRADIEDNDEPSND
jgi:hypothetical protein